MLIVSILQNILELASLLFSCIFVFTVKEANYRDTMIYWFINYNI